MKWPNDPIGNNPLSPWLKSFLAKAKSLEVKQGKGYRVKTSTDGTTLEITATGGNGDSWPPTIYDHTLTYSVGNWVWVQSTDSIVTSGVTDPDTGDVVKAVAGIWRCVQSASPVVNPAGLPAGTYYHIPQVPYPTPDDPTASNMYWLLMSPAINC